MKDIDIAKIRQLLNDAINYERDYAYDYIIKKCMEALTLLPCETCGGSKQVYRRPASGPDGTGLTPEIPCPNCQSKSF